MNEEFKRYAMSKLHFIPAACIVIIAFNIFLMVVFQNPFQSLGFDFELFVFRTTPFSIVFYVLLWFIGIKAAFEETKKLKVADDVGQILSVRGQE